MSRAVDRHVERQRGRVAERLRTLLPHARVEETDAGVTLAARGLMRRWIEDPRLSWWSK